MQNGLHGENARSFANWPATKKMFDKIDTKTTFISELLMLCKAEMLCDSDACDELAWNVDTQLLTTNVTVNKLIQI